MVQLTINVDDEDFWSNILGSGWEDWPWWDDYNYLDGSDWDKIGKLELKVDYDGTKKTKVIGLSDLVDAYETLTAKGMRIDLEDVDADFGDRILQQAVFGEVIFGE